MSKKVKIEEAAAKALLNALLDLLKWDDEAKVYILPEGAFMTADAKVVKYAGEFCKHSIANDAVAQSTTRDEIKAILIQAVKDCSLQNLNESAQPAQESNSSIESHQH